MRKTGRIRRDNTANSSNQNVLSELKKISEQLQRLNSSGKNLSGENKQEEENYIIASYDNNAHNSQTETTNTENKQDSSDQKQDSSDQKQDSSDQKQDSSDQKQDSSDTNLESSYKTISKENAAQILASAQYELSYELEASLNKLRQVIQESEQVAQKISNLLNQRKDGNT